MKRFQQLIAIVSMIIFSFSSYGLEKLRIMT
ncbi:ABC transporter substrate-binding protein, partial [Piscirickettsiaceae bacterium NZ-RLO2]